MVRGVGFGRIAIHGAYTSRQRNINQKVEQDLRGKLGLPATGEIYYVQDRPLYQEYENLVLISTRPTFLQQRRAVIMFTSIW